MKSQISKAAKRFVRALSEQWQEEVSQALLDLEDNQAPASSIELTGYRGYRRLRIGSFRILYRVGKNTVYVLRIEKRSGKTYRGLNPENS